MQFLKYAMQQKKNHLHKNPYSTHSSSFIVIKNELFYSFSCVCVFFFVLASRYVDKF